MSSHLSDDEQAQLSARADDFHAALVRGSGRDWRPFLTGLPENVRPVVLLELAIIDLIYRWDRGEKPRVEEYIARFPDLGPAAMVPTQLIVEEARCRAKAGETFDTAEYRDRFPEQFPRIRADIDQARLPTAAGTLIGTVVTNDGGAAVAQSVGPGGGNGEYEFVRVLGRGVFGEVWLAKKITSGIDKAIKVLTEQADRASSERERRSLELIKNLRHPYLLATEDFWVADNRLHIVMELADGTLRNRLQRCKEAGHPGIPPGELLGYIWEAAEGLDFIHSKHVTHRDVKPDNILLLNGHAKVADFGLARHQEESMAPMKTFAGTPAYMAPEVWGKEGGPASDQYALAVAYVELRQGTPPFAKRTIQELLLAHLEGTLDVADFLGADERRVLTRALARKPEDRYPTCRAFAEALSIALGMSGAPRGGGMASALRAAPDVPTERDEPGGSVGLGSIGITPTVIVPDKELGGPPVPAERERPGPRPVGKFVLAGVLALGVVGAIAAGLWALFGGADARPTDAAGPPIQHGPVPRPPDKPLQPVLPPKAEPDAGSKLVTLADGRTVYDRIVIRAGAEAVRLRLIHAGSGPRPVEPFYLMESKVWNGLYRAGGATPPAESEPNGPDAPVVGATADEAARFAATALGGRLPTPDEWDHAAGLYANTGRPDVVRPGGSPRVGLAKPKPTRGAEAGNDVNEFELRDMAGNGREWTRAVFTKPGEPEKAVGGNPLPEGTLVILRGRNYTLSRGLTFETLTYEQTTPQTQFAAVRSPYTGFRVAVPLR